MAEPVLLDCDPGHDDAIALLLALASPELELLGVTTVSGNQTLEKTTANAIRVLDLAGRDDVPVAAGADRPLVREPYVAAYVHGETGLDGPALPSPQGAPLDQHAVDFIAEQVLASERAVGAGRDGDVAASGELEHPDRVRRRLVQRLVAMRRRDAEELELR